MSSASGTQAVDRAAGLLLAVMEARDPLTFTELQDSSSLAKSTLSRLLSSLERHDLVARGEDGTVRPGGALTRYAHSRRPTDELIEAARPHMTDLSEATGEKINLAVLDAAEVEQISQIDCTYLIGGVNWGDQRIPLHASALGKVFLAYGAETPPGRLKKFSSRTITSKHRSSVPTAAWSGRFPSPDPRCGCPVRSRGTTRNFSSPRPKRPPMRWHRARVRRTQAVRVSRKQEEGWVPHDAGRHLEGAVRRDHGRQRAGRPRLHRPGLGSGHVSGHLALRRLDPVPGGGGRPLRAW